MDVAGVRENATTLSGPWSRSWEPTDPSDILVTFDYGALAPVVCAEEACH